ncbi:hypothetical protein [Chelatococcus reniformis]|uniref:Uncharacterized protein n=1 Tax=Chelatococcus reniformis TaxID=1494448 RepID=A0A916UKS1_9HYPH|nr:hypothetical protein [Chelatococcus reniformis]GGC76703.1 hypothetical protein GCM10010994_38740 [Chelatococcus reniformis]
MADVAEGPTLLVKKFAGLALVILGLLGLTLGYEYDSGSLTWLGILALVIGAGLLALKIIRRNPS